MMQPSPGHADSADLTALVLSGGGARAAYQVGVLAAIADRAPASRFPIITGVSAGAINAMYLAAHRGTLAQAVCGLSDQWRGLTPDQVFRLPTGSLVQAALRWLGHRIRRDHGPGVVRGLLDLNPLRGFLEKALDLSGVDANLADGRLRAVALTATPYGYGATTTFIQGAPDVATWKRAMRIGRRDRLTVDHVMASAAIPILFPAVRLGQHFYADGSVRQTAPLSPAIHLGARRILAIGMRMPGPVGPAASSKAEYPTTAEAMGLLFNSVFLDALDADAERLTRLNGLLELIEPARSAAVGLRPVRLLLWQPSRDLGTLATGSTAELPAGIRWVVQSLGGGQARAATFLSYLLFEPNYVGRLLELGYEDAVTGWSRLEEFLLAPA